VYEGPQYQTQNSEVSTGKSRKVSGSNNLGDSTSPLLWISSKTPATTNVGKDVGKKKPAYTAGGNGS
jgi:hypothetical protein